MTSPIDVANMALDAIGARFTITSLSPPLPAPNAAVVARHYQPKMDALMRSAHWDFARKQIDLTVLKAAMGTPENPNGTTLPIPPVPWQYEYAYPADCLKGRFLIADPPQTGTGTAPPIFAQGTLPPLGWPQLAASPFVIASDTDANGNPIKVILTDLEYAALVYTARIANPDLWEAGFLSAAPIWLGLWLNNPISGDKLRFKELAEIVTSIVLQARVADGNEGFTSQDHQPDWMAARGGISIRRALEPQTWYGWDSLALPGGGVI
jgi:hypothetical protein